MGVIAFDFSKVLIMINFEFCNFCGDYATHTDGKDNPLCDSCFNPNERLKVKGKIIDPADEIVKAKAENTKIDKRKAQ